MILAASSVSNRPHGSAVMAAATAASTCIAAGRSVVPGGLGDLAGLPHRHSSGQRMGSPTAPAADAAIPTRQAINARAEPIQISIRAPSLGRLTENSNARRSARPAPLPPPLSTRQGLLNRRLTVGSMQIRPMRRKLYQLAPFLLPRRRPGVAPDRPADKVEAGSRPTTLAIEHTFISRKGRDTFRPAHKRESKSSLQGLSTLRTHHRARQIGSWRWINITKIVILYRLGAGQAVRRGFPEATSAARR